MRINNEDKVYRNMVGGMNIRAHPPLKGEDSFVIVCILEKRSERRRGLSTHEYSTDRKKEIHHLLLPNEETLER